VRIGRARASVSIPVVANGDLRAPADVRRCREVSGCERFMIGRGAIERPEIFRVLRGIDVEFWPPVRRLALIETYARIALERTPERAHGVLCRVKQWLRAMASVEPALAPCFEAVKRVDRIDVARERVTAEEGRLRASGFGLQDEELRAS
jgi:tRNA-dihydrouridine synthase C